MGLGKTLEIISLVLASKNDKRQVNGIEDSDSDDDDNFDDYFTVSREGM